MMPEIDLATIHLWLTDLGLVGGGYLLGRWHEQRHWRQLINNVASDMIKSQRKIDA